MNLGSAGPRRLQGTQRTLRPGDRAAQRAPVLALTARQLCPDLLHSPKRRARAASGHGSRRAPEVASQLGGPQTGAVRLAGQDLHRGRVLLSRREEPASDAPGIASTSASPATSGPRALSNLIPRRSRSPRGSANAPARRDPQTPGLDRSDSVTGSSPMDDLRARCTSRARRSSTANRQWSRERRSKPAAEREEYARARHVVVADAVVGSAAVQRRKRSPGGARFLRARQAACGGPTTSLGVLLMMQRS